MLDKKAKLTGKWTEKADGMWTCNKNFYVKEGTRTVLVCGPVPRADGTILDGVTRTLDEACELEMKRGS